MAKPPKTIAKRADFLSARYDGTTLRRGAFVLQQRVRPLLDETANNSDTTEPRVGYTASKKVGNAVARNRAKRRLREAVRQVDRALLPANSDTVLIARHNTGSIPFDRLQRDLAATLKQLNQTRSKKKK